MAPSYTFLRPRSISVADLDQAPGKTGSEERESEGKCWKTNKVMNRTVICTRKKAEKHMADTDIFMTSSYRNLFENKQRSPGKVLFDLVCVHLNLSEGDYFGLEYQDQRKMTVWLDLLKPTLKQIRRPKNTILRFVVKFFPPDHTQLLEELTRYLFALQIKHDLACGHLICNDTSAALMVSHIIQSEIGDFDETQSWQHLLHNKYLPDQDAIRDKITDCHRKHVGQTPAESDYQLLEIARRLEMYGVRLHPAKDREGTKLSLAVAHIGVLVFQGYTKINAFNWSKVRKLSFKRKRFLIKLRADPANAHHDTLEFAMASRDCCKIFWKICVDGRTQKQIIDYVKDSELKKVPFERKHSKILSNSSMSPQSSSFRSQVPKESAMSVQVADQPDSTRLGIRAECNGSEEPPATTTNGFHDIPAAPGSDPTQSRQNHHGTGSAPDPQFLNPGPSCRANKGSSSSIPYIDCSDIDSECDVTKNNRAPRGHSSANDSNADEPCVYKNKHGGSSRNGGQAGSLFGDVNGFYHTNHQGLLQQHQQQGIIGLQQQQGMLGNKGAVDQSPVSNNKFNVSHVLTDDVLPNGGSFHGHLPLHSTLLDEIFQGRDKPGAVVGRPLGTGTRSQCSSPVISSFHHRSNSVSQAEMTNGHGQQRSGPRWDDGGHYFSKRPGVFPVETPTSPPPSHPPNHYGSYSPIAPNNTPPHFAKPYHCNNMRNRSDTDPFILSQLTSTPVHQHDPHRSGLHAQAPCSAPMERRVMFLTNGNHAGNPVVPGQARSNTVQRLFGRQGKPGNNPTRNNNQNQPVQMIDGSTSSGSGSDSSDTESDTGSSAYSQPLMYGNPAAVSSMNSNGVNSSPLPRGKFSFGSVKLEEGNDGKREEEGVCYHFNEEDIGGRVSSLRTKTKQGRLNSSAFFNGEGEGEESPGSEDSPEGSPHVVANGNGSVNGRGTGSIGVLGQSPEGRLLSPLTSPLLTDAGCVRHDDEDEARRKKFPTDKAYFIAKELLTTERTYLKDLQVITENVISASYDPVYKFHQGFLKEVEQRLAQEGRSNAHIKGDYQRIGDVLLKNIQGLRQLTVHLQKHSECLVELERACRSNRKAEAACRDFEQQRVCYLPLNIFLLRPLHRLLHYKLILERLCKHYPPTHDDFRDCRAALADISEMVLQLQGAMMKMENFQKLLELKKDLTGIDNLAIPGREFIRLGCLSKLSGKGLQQRMFFLFSDSLVYTSRGMTPSNQFKVHGQLPLYGMTIRESEEEWGVPHSFTLFGQRQSVVVAASCESEMERWVEDIRMAIDLAEQTSSPNTDLLSTSLSDNSKSANGSGPLSSGFVTPVLMSINAELSDDGGAELESEEELCGSRSSLERQGHRGNTTVHVCWHRNTSVSMVDFSVAVENQLSGNLLRKFKNSNGWQKLWVVFTNFSLFFYNLPLLGYSVTVPSESENIHKDYVFKLHFKSHVYYFRSESEYAFERWMEVIRSATCSASRSLPSTRKDLY
ncbi:hypothetical protein FQN60_006583 [Etheostoma spectabile]|uniref:FERM, ARHGEF and pleckstrin domain-containing protein 1 n=1 Tax=Etheostoma spectabile TaxID=54343 RepID=A0A5J5CHB3_9PERO|nr:hypothetical protein FQN60_006583 [Etheostoma spectabile]